MKKLSKISSDVNNISVLSRIANQYGKMNHLITETQWFGPLLLWDIGLYQIEKIKKENIYIYIYTNVCVYVCFNINPVLGKILNKEKFYTTRFEPASASGRHALNR